jgi:hypothetical protein
MGYGCVGIFFVFCFELHSGIRADLCIVVLVRIECIKDAGVDFLIVTLYLHLIMSTTLLDCKQPHKPTLRFEEPSSIIYLHLIMSTTLLDCKQPRKPTLRFGETSSIIDV